MENDALDTNGGGSLLPLALAILGTVLGGLALYIGFTLKQTLSDNDHAATMPVEQWGDFETSLALLDERLNKIDADGKKVAQELQSLVERSRQAFDQVSERLDENRQAINATRGKLQQFAGRLGQPLNLSTTPPAEPLPAPESDQESNAKPAQASAPEAAKRTHIIVPGDTFQKIARQYQLSIQALIAANPDLEPRFLHVGERVILP